jgi:two-component system sensor histidine kinase GlrK
MRLTIFWRIILAQVSLICLIVMVNVYTLSQLQELTHLTQGILSMDAACIAEEKRLVRIILAQMRSVEKFVLFQDKVFYNQFIEGNQTFEVSLGKITACATSPDEQDLLGQVRDLYAVYADSISSAAWRKPAASDERAEVSDAITTSIHALIRLREEIVAQKTAAARDQSAWAARAVRWLTFGSIGLAVLFAYLHARSISRPLKRLADELRLVGKGEFQRSLDIRSPEEVGELARAFNWMAARLARLDEMKEDFIAHISHELRTPLTAMREGMTLLWEEIPGPLTSSQRDIVHVVRSHSERLYQFLATVLDLSKMEAGMMEYVRVPSDLSAVIERSVQTVQLIARRKCIQLEVLCPNVLPVLCLDEARIQQVLDNLLNNAAKFTPEGGIIRVAACLKEKQGERGEERWVEIRVSDTGVGIPSEEIERIFKKFYQSPQHQSQLQRGTGLGLAIARHIVEAHGGRLWVESQPGHGSTFILLLPAHRHEPGRLSQAQVAMAT